MSVYRIARPTPSPRAAPREPPGERHAAEAHGGVRQDERERAEREVELAGERDRDEREGGEGAPAWARTRRLRGARALERREARAAGGRRSSRAGGRRSGRGGTGRSRTRARRAPPRAAGSASARSQAYVSEAGGDDRREQEQFQATTGPNRASSGQNGSPNGQPPSATCGSTSGWKLYGSRQGASPCASWCPRSQKR